ncbi:MAG: NAD(P)/FAD-dependent oxidoreductase [Actinobacteria bacterium]|nr:NAD(P)/FAD-dependent oxidoreductase [Actinomycetota bacterium]
MSTNKFDVLIIGGGHNGLVASCYLAKAGYKVGILEQNSEVGGASVSQRVFPDFDANLSRYSYLVSLFPDKILEDLDLTFTTLSRSVSSFTPEIVGGVDQGLLISSTMDERTRASFQEFTRGESEFAAWQSFYSEVLEMAQVIAPTLLEKLPTRSELEKMVSRPIWHEIFDAPLGETIERRFSNDLIRGVVLTDGLIGTFADAHSFAANTCFAYHLIGNGSGEWKVPLGGMGSLVTELQAKAMGHGVEIMTSHRITKVERISERYRLKSNSGPTFDSTFVLANCAPQSLASLMEVSPPKSLDGSQVKINMLLRRLPRLKSGIDPRLAFAGTFHIDERYSDLQLAYQQSSRDQIPDRIPAEMYCHTLTDSSILSPELNELGYQTLTLFALHTPAPLFEGRNIEVKRVIEEKLLNQLNRYLQDPIEECLAIAADGSLCIETKSPLDLEKELGLPRGNIFHKDLSMPFRKDSDAFGWGVETQFPNLFLCGAGAIRGGGVSGIPGHNAAAAVLEINGL